MTGDISRRELEREYGRQIVTQSLTVCNALTKAVNKDKTIADIVVGAKSSSEAWLILKRMVGDDSRARTREQTKKTFEELSMDNMEAMAEYLYREKSLARNVKCHGIEITEQEISRRALNSLPPADAPEKQNFALKTAYIWATWRVASFAWKRSTGA